MYKCFFNRSKLRGIYPKALKKGTFSLDIIYSRTLSDDNMDKFVKMFYDEFIMRISYWLNNSEVPQQNMKIIISNCKYGIVGHCRKKNIKEISLVLYKDEKKHKEFSFKHKDIVNKTNLLAVIEKIISDFFGK